MNETNIRTDTAPEASGLNVLALGAKNDGTEDISDLVNRATEKSALYFPAGRYLVKKPLKLKNPIFGAGYARNPAQDDMHTWLISEIEHENTNVHEEVGVVSFGGEGRFTVENLNIICHSRECGICIDPCVQGTAVFLNKVGIFDVRGYGILATKGEDVPGFASRPLFFDDLTIWGTRDYALPSVGIYLDHRIGDNRLSNTEIMGTCRGLHLNASFLYGDNMHIWTGCLAGRDNGSWWENTRGIVLGTGDASFMGSNIYVDTSFALLEFHSQRNLLSIHNFISWEDGSPAGCPREDARMFSIPEPLPDEPSVELTDGIVYVNGCDAHPGKLADLTAPMKNARITGMRILTDYEITGKNRHRFAYTNYGTPSYRVPCAAADHTRYVRIAALVAELDGACELICSSTKAESAALRFAMRGGELRCDVRPGLFSGTEFYLRRDDPLIIVYAKTEAGEAVDYSVTTRSSSFGFFPLDLGLIKSRRDYAIKTEVLDSARELTRIDL